MRKSPSQVLKEWTTIYADPYWYVLTDEVRDVLEDYVLNGLEDENETILLERATERNGSGIGKSGRVLVEDLLSSIIRFCS